MDADLRFIGKVGATLAGLSFAALVFGIACAYEPWMPDVVKVKMPWFLVWTFTRNFLTLASSLASFLTMSFIDPKNNAAANESKKSMLKWSGRLCLLCYSAGLVSFLAALIQIIGIMEISIQVGVRGT